VVRSRKWTHFFLNSHKNERWVLFKLFNHYNERRCILINEQGVDVKVREVGTVSMYMVVD
jgi:hypothetical protein